MQDKLVILLLLFLKVYWDFNYQLTIQVESLLQIRHFLSTVSDAKEAGPGLAPSALNAEVALGVWVLPVPNFKYQRRLRRTGHLWGVLCPCSLPLSRFDCKKAGGQLVPRGCLLCPSFLASPYQTAGVGLGS